MLTGDGVNWSHYGLNGLSGVVDEGGGPEMGNGLGNMQALAKALIAGQDGTNPGTGFGEGFPLRVQDLSQTLFNTTVSMEDVVFFQTLIKDPAFNTYTEFNRLLAVTQGAGISLAEGELPEEDDSEYERAFTKIKYMGLTGRVTLQAMMTASAHGPILAQETKNRTIGLISGVERMLFGGCERYVSTEFDGLEESLISSYGSTVQDDGQLSGYDDSVNVIDCRGAPLSYDFVNDGAERVRSEPSFGRATDIYLPNRAKKGLTKILYPANRVNVGQPNDGTLGYVVDKVNTDFGLLKLNATVLQPDSVVPVAAGVGKATKRPPAPTVGAPVAAAYGGTSTNRWAAADAGSYYYKVVARNAKGKSTPVTSAQVAVIAGDKVTISITDNGTDTACYEIHRSDKDGAATTCRYIMTVPRSAAAQSVVDLNRFLPNTSRAFMLTQGQHADEVLRWKQLAPLMKLDLAVLDPSRRFALMLFGALQVMAPKKCLVYINVGQVQTGADA